MRGCTARRAEGWPTGKAGEYVWVEGTRAAMARSAAAGPGAPRRRSVRRGLWWVTCVAGSALARASNRVRATSGARPRRRMAADDAALFAGSRDRRRRPPTAGADRRLPDVGSVPPDCRLRAERRRSCWPRRCRCCDGCGRGGGGRRRSGLIGWFMALTRFEPSVLRAGVMAMLAATVVRARPSAGAPGSAARAGGHRAGRWSIRCWCGRSGSGCRWAPPPGCASVGPWLHHGCRGRRGLRLPLAITLGAQVGVALPSALVFDRLPVVSLPANLARRAGRRLRDALRPAGRAAGRVLAGAACSRW